MAKFTTGKAANINDAFKVKGPAGTVFRIPDALKDAFEEEYAARVGGITWIVQDELTATGGAHPDTAAHVALGLSAVEHDHDTEYETLGHTHDAYAATIHSHAQSAVTNLTTDLAGKAATVHTHAQSAVTNLTTDLAAKAASIHSHAQSQVTNLVTDLAGKAASSHSHVDADLPAGIARDTEVTAAIAQHVATATHGGVGGEHPDLATHDSLGLATDAELAAHAAAADPHPGYLTAAEGNAAYSATGHTHAGGGANVKSGIVNLAAAGTSAVTFVTPFAATPRVVVTYQFASADTSNSISAYNVTVNGFTLKGAGNAAGNVAWIATDAGNS